MLYEIIQYIRENPRIKKTVIIGGFTAIFLVTIYVLASTPVSKPLDVKTTNLQTSSYAQLYGSSLYHFDGLSFMKTDVTSSKTTTLTKARRWPQIQSIKWAGDSGALVTISGSYLYSPAEKAVRDLQIDNLTSGALQNSYIWYVDFATQSVYAIDSRQAENNSYYYDGNSDTFYYVAKDEPVNPKTGAVTSSGESYRFLLSYNTSTKTLKKLAFVKDMRYTLNTSGCGGNSICIISYSHTGERHILKYDGGDAISSVFKTKSGIATTNNPVKFLVTKEASDIPDASAIEGYEYIGPFSYDIHDVSSNKTELNVMSEPISNYTIPLYYDEKLTLYSSTSDSSLSISHNTRSSLGLPMSTSLYKPKVTNSFIVKSIGYSTSPVGFAANGPKNTLVVTSNISLPTKPTTPPTQLVNKCVTQYNSRSEYTAMHSLYTLYVPLDEAFDSTVERIGQCILKNPNDTFGYVFEVMGTDPEYGRIVTN